jgi:hypothetical protein
LALLLAITPGVALHEGIQPTKKAKRENGMDSMLTVADACRLIGADLEPVEPPEGLRVWPGGLATVHQGGRVVGLLHQRVLYRVADD